MIPVKMCVHDVPNGFVRELLDLLDQSAGGGRLGVCVDDEHGIAEQNDGSVAVDLVRRLRDSGVYAAIAKPAYKVNCNAAIILFGDAVLVVDTHSKPSAARALIEQIKKLTDKPVRYVVNTHFHWDHYQGNEAYPSSWPAGVEIIF